MGHVKVKEMLVVSLRDRNSRSWSHLGCSRPIINIFSNKGIAQGCAEVSPKTKGNAVILC